MTLVGHEDQAQFPLATSSSRPMVASGGGGGADSRTDDAHTALVLRWELGSGSRIQATALHLAAGGTYSAVKGKALV